MAQYGDGIARIKEVLGEHPEGLSITDISGALGINRNSIAKYMDILQVQGAVDGRKIGTSKIYFLTKRLPASSIRRFCSGPLLIVNHEQVVIDVNQAFTEYSGIPADRILGKPFDAGPYRFLDGGKPQQVFRRALRGAEQRVFANLSPHADHQPDTLVLVPIVFENSKPGIAVIIDRGQAPAGQGGKDSPAELLTTLDYQVEYYVRHGPDGIIRYVNEPYCRAVGKTRTDLIGRAFKPLVTPEDAERIRVHLHRMTPQYPVGMIEYSVVMANGEVRWQRWQDRVVFTGEGEVSETHSFGIDITDLMTARQHLKKTQETLEDAIAHRTDELRMVNRQLYEEIARREKMEELLQRTQFAMDYAADMVFLVNRNARVQYANRMAIDSSGYDAPELEELSFCDISPDLPLSRWDEIWERLTTEGSQSLQTSFVRKDGTGFPVEMVLKYLEYHGKEFACIFSRNISDRTRMERALLEANRKLNILTSTARHDIQNKITVLLGFLARVRKGTSDPVQLGYLRRQEKAAFAIRDEIQLTRDFKNLGIEPPVWQNLKKVVGMACMRYENQPVPIKSDLPNIEIFADGHLERVFERLFENSLSHGQTVSVIRISAEAGESELTIMVEDDGMGIPDEEKGTLFAGTDSGHLGLFIAHEILSVTGILLREIGTYGNGARFEIRVPETYYRPAAGG